MEIRTEEQVKEGIVTSRAKYLHGCVRCVVESTALDDGKPMDGFIFDEGRLEVLEKEAVKGYSAPAATGPGGPRDYPAGAKYPGR